MKNIQTLIVVAVVAVAGYFLWKHRNDGATATREGSTNSGTTTEAPKDLFSQLLETTKSVFDSAQVIAKTVQSNT